jgi:hypothetical protein
MAVTSIRIQIGKDIAAKVILLKLGVWSITKSRVQENNKLPLGDVARAVIVRK